MPPPPAQPRLKLHNYNNTEAWEAVGAALHDALSFTPANASIYNGTAASTSAAWMEALDGALNATCAPPPPPRLYPTASAHNDAQRRRAVAGLSNRPLPPAIAAAFKAVKDAPAADQPRLQREAKRLLANHHRLLRRAEISNLEFLRTANPHQFFMEASKDLAPGTTTLFAPGHTTIPDEPGQQPAPERFTAFFHELFAKKPVPPAATSSQWLNYVSAYPEPIEWRMQRHFTAAEILPLIFPLYNYGNYVCPATGAPEAGCSLCATLKAQAANWKGADDIYNSPPSHKPRGKSQSAINGPQLLAFLAWSRHSGMSRRNYRLRISTSIAAVLNKFLDEEQMPAGTTNYKAVPLRKPAPAGSIPNWADPRSSYRFITMGPILTKILCLAIDARTIHFVTKNHLVNLPFQGASIPFMSTEWHVLSLIEAVKAEWAQHRNLYLLFVDFKKAYDSVSGEVLSATLLRLGFPPGLVNLLAHWNRTRTTTLYVNGAPSDPIPTVSGIGQGDVFSCILYIIFINSLHNFLGAKGLGVTPYPGVRDVARGFVDDVAALAYTLGQLQATARAVEEWGAAFGHQLQLGHKKTAFIFLAQPSLLKAWCAHVATNPAVIPVTPVTTSLKGGELIPAVEDYKYLGYSIDVHLDESAHLGKLIRYISSNHSRYFGYNNILRRLCFTAVCQVLKTTCLPGYLNCIVNPISTNFRAIDVPINALRRTLLYGLPKSTPRIFLEAESNIPGARFLITRSILTQLLGIHISVYRDAPAVALYHAQRAALAAGGALPRNSWLRRAMAYLDPYVASLGDYMDIHATLHLPPGRQLTPSDATMAAVVYARRVCTAATISETSASTAALVADFSQRPRLHATAKEWYWDLSFGHAHAAAAAAHPARQVSLSSFAAGACGNLCARTTFPLSGRGGACIKALMSARLGGCSLYYEPLGPASWAPCGGAALPANYYHDIARGSQCPLCKGPTADPFHIVCECPHPAVAAERSRLCSSAVQYVPVLAGHIYSANPVPQSRDLDTAVNVARRAAPPDWRSPQGRSLLFRLVMVLPWPAASVVDGDPLATALGSLMDLTIVRNNRLHPIADSWVSWGGKRLISICGVWAGAVDSLP